MKEEKRIEIKCDGVNFQNWFSEKLGKAIVSLTSQIEKNLNNVEEELLVTLNYLISVYLRVIGMGAEGLSSETGEIENLILREGMEGLKQANELFSLGLSLENSKLKQENKIREKDDQNRHRIRSEIKKSRKKRRDSMGTIVNLCNAIENKSEYEERMTSDAEDVISGMSSKKSFLDKYKEY